MIVAVRDLRLTWIEFWFRTCHLEDNEWWRILFQSQTIALKFWIPRSSWFMTYDGFQVRKLHDNDQCQSFQYLVGKLTLILSRLQIWTFWMWLFVLQHSVFKIDDIVRSNWYVYSTFKLTSIFKNVEYQISRHVYLVNFCYHHLCSEV